MQFEINLEGLSEQIQQVVHDAVLSAKEQLAEPRTWYSHHDAVNILGWPEILLKKGVQYGDLSPITLQGRGGTHYSFKDLSEFHDKILKTRKSKNLDPKYLTNNDKVLSINAPRIRDISRNPPTDEPAKGQKRAG